MRVLDLGRKSYEEVWELQKQLVTARANDEIEDTLILVEHDPVYTMGRSSQTDEAPVATSIKVQGLAEVPVVSVERGGKITFHGPGQLVGYPIFKLTNRDLRAFLRDMEKTIMRSLDAGAGVLAKPVPESLILEPGQLQTGVWIGDQKIASIGIAVKQWVTYHGFALNISTDLRYFYAVNPCGFSGDIMTTLEKIIAARTQVANVSISDVRAKVIEALTDGFKSISARLGSIGASSDLQP